MTESRVRHPGQHADYQCRTSLLAEAASDHFPNIFTDIEQSELIHAAAATVADFTTALIDGLHGRGCPVREELDIAAITNSDGYRPYCARCGAEIHIFLGLAGWQHYQGQGVTAEIISLDHEPSLAWEPADEISPRSGMLVHST